MTEFQSARKFQRATPEVFGSAVISLISSLAKSAQFLIPLGLPSRVTKAATDLDTMPLLGNFFSHPG